MTKKMRMLLLMAPLISLASLRPAAAAGPYDGISARLEPLVAAEMKAKGVPAVSIALVADQDIVWAHGFGLADPGRRIPATAETIYRVGSVSKLFTDIALLQLAERGAIDLDAPMTAVLPEFAPRNPFGRPITLRQMLAHRSGLVREPPVGHYFDPTKPSLADTVRSLNDTELVYEPQTHTKYSNAAIAVVGHVLERMQHEPFAPYIKRSVLEPLGMTQSDFELRPDLAPELAKAIMWTYDGRVFEAPTFPLGTAPAGNVYSTVNDLGRFLKVLFADGRGPNGPILRPETLRTMYAPQSAKDGENRRFGLGFHVEEWNGRTRIGHGGAVYGFATELAALPSEKLGVAVVATKDCANGVARRLADAALTCLLAAKDGKSLPDFEQTEAIDPEVAASFQGRYAADGSAFELIARGGSLYWQPADGGLRRELRRMNRALCADDAFGFGAPRLVTEGASRLVLGATTYERVATGRPEPCPDRWAGLIGEYGWDHNILYILEKDRRLHALIEWFELDPLEELEPNVFAFPRKGLYDGEKLIFTRGPDGRATQVTAASVVFRRRHIDGDDGPTFHITPRRPIAELRATARAASPPAERGELRKAELVDLATLDPTIKLDIRYATSNNFLGVPLYTSPRAFLQRPAAGALLRAHQALAKGGFGLLIHDAYRPWYVTRMFWDATPEAQHNFVADPAKGSKHNRGAAVDLTLYDRATGRPVPMVGGYDEFSDRSNPFYPGGTSLERWHRDLLRHAMEREGFAVNEFEWWHFDHRDWAKYPLLNATFEELGGRRSPE